MTDAILPPDQCSTMRDVREGVDATDQALMDLIETRFGYMRAAARIKQDRSAVRDEQRKADVIAAVVARARTATLPERALADIWERLVETSIAYELVEWDRIRS